MPGVFVGSVHSGEVVIKVTTALVGGGGSGIGRAAAERLARAGFDVVIAGRTEGRLRDTAAELTALTGREVGFVVADLADAGAAPALVAGVEARHGELGVLVLNAGGPPPGRILDVDDAGWRAGADLLLHGPLALARAVLPGMRARGSGRIVVVTSTAVKSPIPELAISTALRSAMTAAAKLLASEVAADGVTVNCVAPGAIATERRAQVLAHRAEVAGSSVEALDAADLADVPAGRAADPGEVADAIAFLASEQAGYITGTVLTVDGGRTEAIG